MLKLQPLWVTDPTLEAVVPTALETKSLMKDANAAVGASWIADIAKPLKRADIDTRRSEFQTAAIHMVFKRFI